MAANNDALTAEEVAEILQVSKNTVYNLAKSGEISSYNVGRKLRFTLKDVEAYIARAKKGSASTAVSRSRAATSAFPAQAASGDQFVVAGNDLTADVLANYLGGSGIPVSRSYRGSYNALVDMYHGAAQAAVVHLYDAETDSYNIPYVRRLLPGMSVMVIRLARRRQGFLVARGNPLGMRAWGDLLKPGVRLVNRERGSGSRVLLDQKLCAMEARPWEIVGYDREVSAALALGSFIARGGADVGVGSERVFHQVSGLDFLPLQEETLDLVLAKNAQTEKIVHLIRALLRSDNFRSEFTATVGYDVKKMGAVLLDC